MSERITDILDSLKAIKGVHGAALIEKFGLIINDYSHQIYGFCKDCKKKKKN